MNLLTRLSYLDYEALSGYQISTYTPEQVGQKVVLPLLNRTYFKAMSGSDAGSDSDLDLDNLEEVDDLGDVNNGDDSSEDNNDSDEKEFNEDAEDTEALQAPDFGDAVSRVLAKKISAPQPILLGKRKERNEVDKERLKKKKQNEKIRARHILLNKERNENPEFDPQEKKLLRIATKGVVTLFNAISARQQEDKAEQAQHDFEVAERREKKQKVEVNNLSSKGFLEAIKTKASSKVSEPSENKQAFLTDNFMMQKQGVKDWNKQLDSEEEEMEQEMEEGEEEVAQESD
jgi:hypothetical protein